MSIEQSFSEHAEVVASARAELPGVLDLIAARTARALRAGGKVLVCGNGGSAADAQHFAAELVGRFERERQGLAAIALTTDSSNLTAIANDYGYDRVFARQVEALARDGDVLYGISTSGNSPNVVAAMHRGRDAGCYCVGFTGRGGGELASVADVTVRAPSDRVARIQEVHEICLHALAESIELRLCSG